MAVIINELEVVIDTPSPQPKGPPAAGGGSQQMKVLDVTDVMERRERQDLRLYAH